MASCDDSDSKATLSDCPCICCCSPEYGSDKTIVTPDRNTFEYRRYLINQYYFHGFILRRKKKMQSNEELFIYYIEPTDDHTITTENCTYTDKVTGEQKTVKKYRGYTTKKYKICSTCASLSDLETRLGRILHIPLSYSV